MKKLTAIIGICLIACATQAKTAGSCDSAPASSTEIKSQSEKSQKHFDPQEVLAKINSALSERQSEKQRASSEGRTDIASALDKIIADLNSMKTAINDKDKDAFKTANEQREKDRQALEALRKANRQENKHEKNSPSKTSAPSAKL